MLAELLILLVHPAHCQIFNAEWLDVWNLEHGPRPQTICFGLPVQFNQKAFGGVIALGHKFKVTPVSHQLDPTHILILPRKPGVNEVFRQGRNDSRRIQNFDLFLGLLQQNIPCTRRTSAKAIVGIDRPQGKVAGFSVEKTGTKALLIEVNLNTQAIIPSFRGINFSQQNCGK